MENKDIMAEAVQHVIMETADPEQLCTGKIRSDGRGGLKGSFAELAFVLGIKVETILPHTRRGNSIEERCFGTINLTSSSQDLSILE